MKSNSCFYGLFLSLLFFCFSNCKHSPDVANMFEVEYVGSGACCTNLVILNGATYLPEDCDLANGVTNLWATNLELFDIPNNFEVGDILSINLEKESGCIEQEDCDSIVCDQMHGIRVRLLNVDSK